MGVRRRAPVLCAAWVLCAAGCGTLEEVPADPVLARAQLPARTPMSLPGPAFTPPSGKSPLPDSSPPADTSDTPLSINLATALRLAGARPLDVQIASKQVAAAAARADLARLLWVPTLDLGTDYNVHTGPIQATTGGVVNVTRQSFMAGLQPNVVFAFSEAIYAPLATRQELRARQAQQQATINDATLDVADAYFGVQQARGELAAALVAVKHAEQLAVKTARDVIAKGYAP